LGASIFLGAIGCLAWLGGAPGETWHLTVRWVALALVLLPIPVLFWANHRAANVPEFLWTLGATPFERDGFCFLVFPEEVDGQPCLSVHYQNQYSGRSEALLVIQPAQGLLTRGDSRLGVRVLIKAGSAEYGHLSIAMPFPRNSRGKTL